ncbi:MAG: DUF3082 domain-containing protein [Prochloraceae cyanobacterium]|nr:DUF3082 domain-containing protein [Prochloraceae cyanobacterium]
MSNSEIEQKKPTPLRCLVGASISGSLGYALYLLTTSIAVSFATKPVQSTNPFVINLSAAVRTLVVGVSTLATCLFAITTLGLILLAIQLVIQGFKQEEDLTSRENKK